MIHPQACVMPGAKLGERVSVGPFAFIDNNVEIGDDAVVMPNATVLSGSRIGKSVTLFPGSVVGAIPQDLKFKGEETTAEVGDNTVIRECVTINRGTADRFTTRVGSNCLVMAYSHVAHDVLIGNNCIIANSASIAGHVVIDDFVTIEGVVAIQQFVHIGRFAFIAGGSLVRKNVPPFVKAAREPLMFVGVNTVGMRRRGLSDADIAICESVYRLLFVQHANLSTGIEQIKAQITQSILRDEILDFIKASEKGIIRGLS